MGYAKVPEKPTRQFPKKDLNAPNVVHHGAGIIIFNFDRF